MTHFKALALAAGLALGAGHAGAQQQYLTIAATGQSSSYYGYHVAISQLLEQKLGMNATVQETGGGADNLRLLQQGAADWGQFSVRSLYETYNGVGARDGSPPEEELRVFWLVNPIGYFPVVDEGLGIETLQDLDGKAFQAGARGSATERMINDYFNVLGIAPDWFVGGYSDAVEAMKDRRLTGFVKSGSMATADATIMDVQTSGPIHMLDFTEDDIAKIREVYPYAAFQDVDPAVMNTNAATVPADYLAMITTSTLDEETAYQIIKTVNENVAFQADVFPAVSGADLIRQTVENANTPLHAGVVRYARELGIEVPTGLVPPEAE